MSRVANFYARTKEVVTTVSRPRFKVPDWVTAVGGILLRLVFRVAVAIVIMAILYFVTGSIWIVF